MDAYNIEEEKLFKLKNIDLVDNILDDYEKSKEKELNNIKNNNVTEEEILEDYEKTKKQDIYDVNNDVIQKTSELNDYTYTKDIDMNDITAENE